VMFILSQESGVRLGFFQLGKLTKNAFIEDVNGKFGIECLNAHWFRLMDEARAIIDQ